MVEKLVAEFLDFSKFDSTIKYTERAKHAMEIAADNANKFDIIVAVGGDGSVNEIGKQLINTNTSFAIIPAGSGNGLARNLHIPMNIKKAILLINKGKTKAIDVVKINNDHFLGTAGFGFDAYISWKFEEAPTRALLTYLKVAFIGFWTYKSADYTVRYNDKEEQISKGMLVTFANSKQYGNNILIAPNAIIDDGLIRLVIVEKFPIIYLPIFGFYFLSKQIHKFKFTKQLNIKKQY